MFKDVSYVLECRLQNNLLYLLIYWFLRYLKD